MKKKLITGTFLLTLTGCISRLIGFYYKIFLSRIIGAEGLGIYQLVFSVFILFLAVSSAGIQTAVSRFSAASRTDRRARGYLLIGIVLALSLSLISMLIIHLKGDWLCRIMMDNADEKILLSIMSWAIPLASVHSCINGYFYGKKKAAVPAAAQVFEQVIRVGSIWILWKIALSEGHVLPVSTVVWGIVIGELSSAFLCITAVLFTGEPGSGKRAGSGRWHGNSKWHGSGRRPAQKRKKASREVPGRLLHGAKPMCDNLIRTAAPLTANRLLTSILGSVESLLIPYSLRAFGYSSSDALSVYGILTGMVFSTIMFPAVISNSFSSMLLPTISEAAGSDRFGFVRHAIKKTTELSVILGLICTLGFLLGGEWAGTHLFHNALAGEYLRALSFLSPFLFLGATLTSILHGMGRTSVTIAINLASSLLRIGFIGIGIPRLGLQAYLWGMLAGQILLSGLTFLCCVKYSKSPVRSPR